jgi:hypothetical protein
MPIHGRVPVRFLEHPLDCLARAGFEIGMRERAAALAGTLTIASALGSGTEITLVVPGRVIDRPANE